MSVRTTLARAAGAALLTTSLAVGALAVPSQAAPGPGLTQAASKCSQARAYSRDAAARVADAQAAVDRATASVNYWKAQRDAARKGSKAYRDAVRQIRTSKQQRAAAVGERNRAQQDRAQARALVKRYC